METNKTGISVVIPCYRSGQNINDLVQELLKELPLMAASFEIILVNDGSGDDTFGRISALADQHPEVQSLDLMRNFGQHSALYVGIAHSSMPLIVTMDDDLQHPPTEIPLLLSKLNEGYDLVYGVPHKEQHGWWRDLSSVLMKKMLEATLSVHFASDTSAFRLFRGEMAQSFDSFSGPFVDIDALLCWCTRSTTTQETRHNPRKYGESNYSFRKLISHTLKMVTSYSTLPLRLPSFIGFFLTLFGLVVFGYVIFNYIFFEQTVAGFTFLASIIALFSGAQLFVVGVLGEYLARVHFQSMGYPIAVLRDRVKPAPEDPSDS